MSVSLYKTQRCRYFDALGHPVRPYCTQGNRCRFIHPNDHQWAGARQRGDTPPPENRVGTKGKNSLRSRLSSGSHPHHRSRSSPLLPQADLFKRKQDDIVRDRDGDEKSARKGDRKRKFESWEERYVPERDAAADHGGSLKRANDEVDTYPNQRPRKSEKTPNRSVSRSGLTSNNQSTDQMTRAAPHDSKVTEKHSKPMSNVSDTFHRLAKLCGKIVQDTCFLDREEDKLEAFTSLSLELSRAAPSTAMAATPALAAVIANHAKIRQHVEDHIRELESLWRMLFSTLEEDISKVIDSRLRKAIAALHTEEDSKLRAITHHSSLKLLADAPCGACGETPTPHHPMDGWKKNAAERTRAYSEQSVISVDVVAGANGSPDQNHHRLALPSMSLVEPKQEQDLRTNLTNVLEGIKIQMNRQTEALQQLAKENLQLNCTTEYSRSPAPSDSCASSRREPSIGFGPTMHFDHQL
ncbi:hypothetical protein BDN67DRAFT_962451 [Paxillus ammoniavirescens]|nr:hypothetical protein BDN67DRAFT_962451 [Paxillus ammoniavirescens]